MSKDKNKDKERDNNALGKLSYVQTKVVWGLWSFPQHSSTNNGNLVGLDDHEFVMPVGCNLLYLNTNSLHHRRATIIDSQFPDVIHVNMLCLSLDCKYLATTVKFKNGSRAEINILIYHTAGRFQDSMKPRLINYTADDLDEDEEVELQAAALAFSHDSQFLAIAPSHPSIGILIMEQFKGSIFQTIPLESVPCSLSFHPSDASKLCVTGKHSLLKFWRFTAKTAHIAPVVGLRKGDFTYSCHAWLQSTVESSVVAVGSLEGFVFPVQNCEQRAPAHQAFGRVEDRDPDEQGVSQLLTKGDHLLAVSRHRLILYEQRRVVLKAGSGLSTILAPLACYRLNVDRLCGLQFVSRESITSFALVAASPSALLHLDQLISDYDLSGGLVAQNKDGHVSEQVIEWLDRDCGSGLPFDSNSSSGSGQQQQLSSAAGNTNNSNNDNNEISRCGKAIFRCHSKAVSCLSVAQRGQSCLSFSYNDGTARIWDLSARPKPSPFRACWLVEDYRDRPEQLPFHMDLHPGGTQVAVASETEVREYAVADSELDLIRRFGVRTPFQGSSGVPVVVTQPVSLVRYSHGGHLLAVVTGKIAQLFSVFQPESDLPKPGDTPLRVVALCDHIAPITDLIFLRGDTKIVTSSSDGCVYQWAVGHAARDKEFVLKGIAATHIAASLHQRVGGMIAVSFVGAAAESVSTAAAVINKRRTSILMNRRMSSRGFGDDSNNNGPSRDSSADLSKALSAFAVNKSNNDNSSSLHNQLLKDAAATLASARAAQGQPTESQSQQQQREKNGGSVGSQNFLAFWATGDISSAPQLVYLDQPVRAMALGRSGGADRLDLCVLGFPDGRVLVSLLPVPLISLDLSGSRPPSRNVNPAQSGGGVYSIINAARVQANVNKQRNRKHSQLLASHGEQSDEKVAEGVAFNRGNSNTATKGRKPAVSGGGHHANPRENALQRWSIIQETVTSPTAATVHGDDSNNHTEDNSNGGDGKEKEKDKDNSNNIRLILDTDKCRVIRVFVGAVCSLAFSSDGEWLIAGGEDGCVALLATARQDNDSSIDDDYDYDYENDKDAPRQFFLLEKSRLSSLRSKLGELESALDQSYKDSELHVHKLMEGKEKILQELETRLRKEIAKRDDAIVSGRKEYLSMKRSMTEQLDSLNKTSQEALSAMELQYEKRLAGDALYLDKLKQAYDEYVLHMKLDMGELNKSTSNKVRQIEADRARAVHEAEKQKMAVLTYYEYLKRRQEEVLEGLEEQQADERIKLKQLVESASAQLTNAQAAHLQHEVAHNRAVLKLNSELGGKDMEIMRVHTDIDWANDRILKLEESLAHATAELKARSELVEKWEMKLGDATKRVEDLEKIRGTLMAQLNEMGQALGPRDSELRRASEKLQEMTREYEVALSAIADKDKALDHKAQSLILLQKQVRELRQAGSGKDAALARAATLLHELIFTMQEARFMPHKSSAQLENEAARSAKKSKQDNDKTSSNGKGASNKKDSNKPAVEDIAETATSTGQQQQRPRAIASDPYYFINSLRLEENAESKLRSLYDVLKAFLEPDLSRQQGKAASGNNNNGKGNNTIEIIDEAEAIRREQDRHVSLLHRNLQVLQSGIETTQQAAANKVAHHLADNQSLLREVNNLRAEVKGLSLDKQRLQAMLDFSNARHAEQLDRERQEQQLLKQLHSTDDFHNGHNNNHNTNTNSTGYSSRMATEREGNRTDSFRDTLPSSSSNNERRASSIVQVILDQPHSTGQQQSLQGLFPRLVSPAPALSGASGSNNKKMALSSSLDADRFPVSKDNARQVRGLAVGGANKTQPMPVSSGQQEMDLTGSGMTAEQKIAALMKLNQDEIKITSKGRS